MGSDHCRTFRLLEVDVLLEVESGHDILVEQSTELVGVRSFHALHIIVYYCYLGVKTVDLALTHLPYLHTHLGVPQILGVNKN